MIRENDNWDRTSCQRITFIGTWTSSAIEKYGTNSIKSLKISQNSILYSHHDDNNNSSKNSIW
jgi:hypothetical protein